MTLSEKLMRLLALSVCVENQCDGCGLTTMLTTDQSPQHAEIVSALVGLVGTLQHITTAHERTDNAGLLRLIAQDALKLLETVIAKAEEGRE